MAEEGSALEWVESGGGGGTREALGEGILSVLRPVVAELETRVRATRSSQIRLRAQMEELAEELRSVSDGQESRVALEPYVRKLQESKKRVAVVASILHNTQDRLSKLQSHVAKETARRKSLLEPPLPPTPPQPPS